MSLHDSMSLYDSMSKSITAQHCLEIQHLARQACGSPSFARSVRIGSHPAPHLRKVGCQVAHPRRPKVVGKPKKFRFGFGRNMFQFRSLDSLHFRCFGQKSVSFAHSQGNSTTTSARMTLVIAQMLIQVTHSTLRLECILKNGSLFRGGLSGEIMVEKRI